MLVKILATDLQPASIIDDKGFTKILKVVGPSTSYLVVKPSCEIVFDIFIVPRIKILWNSCLKGITVL